MSPAQAVKSAGGLLQTGAAAVKLEGGERMADRILVVEHGRVQEIGSHEELLAKGGRYAELFELQAAGYR